MEMAVVVISNDPPSFLIWKVKNIALSLGTIKDLENMWKTKSAGAEIVSIFRTTGKDVIVELSEGLAFHAQGRTRKILRSGNRAMKPRASRGCVTPLRNKDLSEAWRASASRDNMRERSACAYLDVGHVKLSVSDVIRDCFSTVNVQLEQGGVKRLKASISILLSAICRKAVGEQARNGRVPVLTFLLYCQSGDSLRWTNRRSP